MELFNNTLTQFHFLQPYWLLLCPMVLGVAYFTTKTRFSRTHWEQVCDRELLPFLEHKGEAASKWLPVSLTVAGLLLVVAAAQPVWQKQPQPIFKQGDALVIALDLSASMNAADIKPSRLQRAHFKIEDLVARMPDTQVALVVYAADAFSVTPLTDDSDTILAQLPAMTPDIMPAQGSRADKALLLADELLTQAGVTAGNILLISDEVLPVQIAATATRLKSQGRQISILAVGSEEGAPIETNSGLLKGSNGQVVVAKTELSLMQEAAGLGGGQARMITPDDHDINELISQFQRSDHLPIESKNKVDQWVAEGPWLVLFSLPLLLIVFRRGILTLFVPLLLPALFLGGVSHSSNLQADTVSNDAAVDKNSNEEGSQFWRNLWETNDQQALQLYQAGDKAAAAEKFEDPRWKQLSYYENGQYANALTSLREPKIAADWYNQGNVLARQGDFDKALSAYDKALQLQPDFEDASYNRSLIEELLQQQEQAKQNQNGQPNSEQKEGESQESHAEGSDTKGANSQDSEGSVSEDTNTEGKGPQDGSSHNANAQDSGFDNQSKASKQHAKNSMSGDQASSDSTDEQSDKEKDAINQQLQQALKDKIDQTLKDDGSEPSSIKKASDDDKKSNQVEVARASEQAGQPLDEESQAKQQLLNRIEDDPAGLWRRKFIYQYRQESDGQEVEEKQW